MSSALYGVGFLIVIIGIIYMGHLMHIPQTWMIGIVILLVGVGILSAVQTMKGSK